MAMQIVQVSRLSGAVADIAISGLPGWVTILPSRAVGQIDLRVWAPVGVEVFVRPPMPVPASLQQKSVEDEPFW